MNKSVAVPPPPRPWYRHVWVWLIMTPPLAAVVAGTGTVVVALRNAPAIVVDDYRQIGIANHLKQERDAEAARRGLTARLRVTDQVMVVTIDAGTGFQDPPQSLTLQLFHPTLPARDAVLILHRGADQAYAAPMPVLARANYHLQLLPEQEDWRLVGRWQAGGTTARIGTGGNAD